MDYSQFRNKGTVSAVGVNHRALITRTLTKYAVDYALYRELLQNSADARASSASILFRPDASFTPSNMTTIHTSNVTKLTFRNDGEKFSPDDWARLCEIAKGNPNESKIGAFGVGFYSTFELTDEPLVHSGTSIMAFRYQGDQLTYSQVEAPNVDGTIIDLPYRAHSPMPDLVKFTAFLAQCFVLIPLEKIEVKLGTLMLLELDKVSSPPRSLTLPRDLNLYSPNGSLRLISQTQTGLKVTIKYLNSTQMPPEKLSSITGIFSFGKRLVHSLTTGSENPEEISQLSCFLSRIDAEVKVSVSSSFAQKMRDTLLKGPPKVARMALLARSKDEQENSQLKPPLSDYIFPPEFKDAKIFIGFPTRQSTGLRSHLSLSQVIPTMERTAIDMSNAFVKDWNSQMLYMAGIMARCTYESELTTISHIQDIEKQLDLAAYVIQRFEIADSAPDPVVGQYIAAGFWKSSKVLLLPSQMGVLPSSKVRDPGMVPVSLLKSIPIVTGLKGPFLEQMKELGYLRKVGIEDVSSAMEKEPISVSAFKDLVSWIDQSKLKSSHPKQLLTLLREAIVSKDKERLFPLGSIHHFVDSSVIFEKLPLPGNCLPADIIADIPKAQLKSLGYTSLEIPDWVSFMQTEFQINKSLKDKFCLPFLECLSHNWDRLDNSRKNSVIASLAKMECIPTETGVKLPKDAYISTIPLFPDVPVVSAEVSASKRFLVDLGVRETISMELVLGTLNDPLSNTAWSTEDIVKYFTANRSKLKTSDWEMLLKGPFFQEAQSKQRRPASDIFAPHKSLKELGFPTLSWLADWNDLSQEARLMYKLGLRQCPPLRELFDVAVRKNQVSLALQYFIEKMESNMYSTEALLSLDRKIIPSKGKLCRPQECFSDPEAALLRFEVIDRQYEKNASKLGVQSTPSATKLTEALISHPPSSMSEADDIFTYLSKHISLFSDKELNILRGSQIIPIRPQVWASPEKVYLNGDVDDLDGLRDLFYFIKPARSSVVFLNQVGARNSPDMIAIVTELVQNPNRVFTLSGSATKYRLLLTKIFSRWSQISRVPGLVSQMKAAPILLGLKYHDDDSKPDMKLCNASQVTIVDDILIFNNFKKLVMTAPQLDALEELYMRLGARTLSSLMIERRDIGPRVEYSKAETVGHRIRERLGLYLDTTSRQTRISSGAIAQMRVEFCFHIKIIQKLENTPEITSSTTACVLNETSTLCLTPSFHWFDVAQALSKYTMKTPDPESVIVLEMSLASDLETLKKKGYNVDRLIRQKKQEEELTMLMEKERLAQEQAQIKQERMEREAAERAILMKEKRMNANNEEHHRLLQEDGEPATPQRPNNTENVNVKGLQAPPMRYPKNIPVPTDSSLMSRLKNRFGREGISGASSPSAVGHLPQVKHENPGSSADVDKSLLRKGISSVHSFKKKGLAPPTSIPSKQEADTPLSTRCKENMIDELEFVDKLPTGVDLYKSKGEAVPEIESAIRFSKILEVCGTVFGLDFQQFAIFNGCTKIIAFNTGGSLFFNLHVFRNSSITSQAKCVDYWYPIVAHELAHNLVSNHGSSHSFFTESYIQEYLERLRQLNM